MNRVRSLSGALSAAQLALTICTSAQTSPSEYRVLLRGRTEEASALPQVIDSLSQAEVIFLGEEHDHAGGHALQLRILQALYEKLTAGKPAVKADRPPLVLSMEMFERDVQGVLDEYLAGHITESAFLQASRPWPSYKTDYRPLVEFCKEKGLPVIAANPPRRYVNIVSRKGQAALLTLPKDSLRYLPRLPYSMEIPAGYAAELDRVFGPSHATGQAPAAPAGMPSVENLKQAQGLWDAGMHDSVLKAVRRYKGARIVQMNGAMHSDRGYGIVDRLRHAAPKLKIVTVSIKSDPAYPNIASDKYADTADYVILTPPDPNK